MTGRTKILSVINELYFGGDENRLLAMARSLDLDRFDLTVVTLKQPNEELDPHYGTMRQQYAAAGVEVLNLGEGHPNEGLPAGHPLRVARSAQMFLRTVGKVSDMVRERKIDVIDAHLGPGNLVGVMSGVATNTPRVVTTYHVEQWDPNWVWWPVHQWTLGMSNAIVTDSRACADQIERWMIRNGKRIDVIPNGVVPPVSGKSNAELRDAFGLPADPAIKVVGQVATLLPTKGHAILIESASKVLEAFPQAAFLIVGYVREDPSYRDRLLELASSLRIADRVRIVSYPGPIGDVWKVIDIHAHPTMLDSLPNAIIEGMSLGKPAVVTAVGGIPTLVENEATGLVIPPNDVPALATALTRLLTEEAVATKFGQAARLRYEEQYTPAMMARRLEALFEEVAR